MPDSAARRPPDGLGEAGREAWAEAWAAGWLTAADRAGVNAKALSTYMGHANIAITLDRYGHLMPGNEDEAAGLLDAYLERAREPQARANLVPVNA
jgi:integrase